MIASYNRRSLALGIPGIVLQNGGLIAAPLLAGRPGDDLTTGTIASLGAALVGTVLLLSGLGLYAKSKGHSSMWGIVGFLGLIGLLVLGLLPDKTRASTAAGEAPSPASDNLLARVSVYLGVVALIPFLGFPLGIGGLVCGIIAYRRCAERGGRRTSIAGLVLNGIALLIWPVLIGAGLLLSLFEKPLPRSKPRPQPAPQKAPAH